LSLAKEFFFGSVLTTRRYLFLHTSLVPAITISNRLHLLLWWK